MKTTNEAERLASTPHHELRNATALSGAVVGATAGMLGGIVGIGAAGLLGALMGALGGLVLERENRRAMEHEHGPDAPRTSADSLIEPPCEDCVRVRERSGGSTTWCARHNGHHAHARLHYEYPQSFGNGSMFVRPGW